MARLPAAVAVAAVLVLATGISPGNGCLSLPGDQFPSTLIDVYKFLASLPPMRIIPKGDPSRSMASDGNGNVVLTKTNCSDSRQLWVRDSFSPAYLNLTAGPNLSPPSGGDKPFALVNLGSLKDSKELQAVELLDRKAYPHVRLARYNPNSVPLLMLWTQDASVDGDSFQKIRSLKYPNLVLDSRGGENAPVGRISETFPDKGHFLWKMEGFLSNP